MHASLVQRRDQGKTFRRVGLTLWPLPWLQFRAASDLELAAAALEQDFERESRSEARHRRAASVCSQVRTEYSHHIIHVCLPSHICLMRS